jgi:hypothetical protein
VAWEMHWPMGIAVLLGAIKTTQLSWSLNWASPPPEEKGVKSGPLDTPLQEQPQIVPALSQSTLIPPSSCFPDSRQKKNFHCPIPPAEVHFLCPIPPAERHFPFFLCI